MITESDVDSLDEALPVDANIRVCTPSVESELDTTDTDSGDTNNMTGSIQTVTQDDSNMLNLVVSADTTDATATAHMSLTSMTARALAIELLSKADDLDSPVVDVLDDECSNMIAGHSYQEYQE